MQLECLVNVTLIMSHLMRPEAYSLTIYRLAVLADVPCRSGTFPALVLSTAFSV